MLYRVITRVARINPLTRRPQWRVIGCYETVSMKFIESGKTSSHLSIRKRPIGSFY
jgi:hypothetical protein